MGLGKIFTHWRQGKILKQVFYIACIINTQAFYDFDEVRHEIEQETDKVAGQNKVYNVHWLY